MPLPLPQPFPALQGSGEARSLSGPASGCSPHGVQKAAGWDCLPQPGHHLGLQLPNPNIRGRGWWWGWLKPHVLSPGHKGRILHLPSSQPTPCLPLTPFPSLLSSPPQAQATSWSSHGRWCPQVLLLLQPLTFPCTLTNLSPSPRKDPD